MSPDPLPAEAPARAARPFVWECGICPRRVEFGLRELDRFVEGDWPLCCGRAGLVYPIGRAPACDSPPVD